jgi:hypothetical protein
MKAHRLFAGASPGPEALKVACEAFDQAWKSLSGNFGSDNNDAVEAARLELENAVLAVMSEDSRDPIQGKSAALQMVALNGRVRA